MRGESCVGLASLFCLTASVLLIFANISQIRSTGVPSKLSMINTANYVAALTADPGDSVHSLQPLYVTNSSLPARDGQGLHHIYAWGLYGYCAYIEAGNPKGSCGGTAISSKFVPWDVLFSEVPSDYKNQTQQLVPETSVFRNSAYLASLSRPASIFIFLGSLCAGVALVSGPIKSILTFVLSSLASILGCVFLLVGASMWTSIVVQTKELNEVMASGSTPLGIEVSFGQALGLIWAALVMLIAAVVPYTLSMIAFLRIKWHSRW